MQQSLHFLQAPVLELKSLLQHEMQANPVLEENPPEPTEDEDRWDDEIEELRQHDEEWRDYFSQSRQPSSNASDLQKKREFFFESQIEQESLSDHLLGQLTLGTSREDLLKAGEEIIGNINEDGFLAVGVEEIAHSTGLSIDAIMESLNLIQTFHPPGVAGRNLSECLAIQLSQRGKPDDSLEMRLVRHDLDRLGRKRFQELARDYGANLDQVRDAANYIATLQPRPGSAFSPESPQNIVQPEAAFILNDDGRWDVAMNQDPVPRLRISDTYKDLLGKDTRDGELKEYLKDRIRAGRFLIKCIHQRQDTIENILREIIKHQSDFLERGKSALHPLTMNQVAEAVGVHETTVSRAVANKYVETPWGIFPIKFFFTSGYRTAEGENLSNTSIKDAIGEMISREDPANPLSDAEIVDILKEKGVNLARRTVAKYRAELSILPSNLRRQR